MFLRSISKQLADGLSGLQLALLLIGLLALCTWGIALLGAWLSPAAAERVLGRWQVVDAELGVELRPMTGGLQSPDELTDSSLVHLFRGAEFVIEADRIRVRLQCDQQVLHEERGYQILTDQGDRLEIELRALDGAGFEGQATLILQGDDRLTYRKHGTRLRLPLQRAHPVSTGGAA